MTIYLIIKILHIISSTILFGTGMGIAFFMYRTKFTTNLQEKYYAIRNTVLADFIFTTPAVIVQPLTGIALIWLLGYPWDAPWLLATYVLYVFIGCFWLPVVWIQIKLRNILAHCIQNQTDLPANYYKLFNIWFLFGFPAFLGIIVIFYLMVAKIVPFSMWP
ncbi:integral membrane protein [Legionella beliardensis]|uniref:Integral membrane protein n=1 Tax=Legionella beliardensis TaxID=91822 RepID=A0A378I136_9GAMM|nr:DUF2269 domain-containing protein [Legionella beliardensis]STX28898.1 integral membrane protein [Legionella beliardensis]